MLVSLAADSGLDSGPLLSPGGAGHTDPVVDDHAVDLRDLQTGPEGRSHTQGEGQSEHLDGLTAPGDPKPKPLTCSWASWSTPASRSEETNQTEPQFGPQPASPPLEPLERHLALLLTFLTSSLQLQALICPLPALSRWQSVDSRQKTGPS